MQLFQLVMQIVSLLGGNYAAVIPLLTQLVAAIKAKDVATALSIIMQLVSLFVTPKPGPTPTPGPTPVFATPMSAADAEHLFRSEAIASGCPASDVDDLVDSLK